MSRTMHPHSSYPAHPPPPIIGGSDSKAVYDDQPQQQLQYPPFGYRDPRVPPQNRVMSYHQMGTWQSNVQLHDDHQHNNQHHHQHNNGIHQNAMFEMSPGPALQFDDSWSAPSPMAVTPQRPQHNNNNNYYAPSSPPASPPTSPAVARAAAAAAAPPPAATPTKPRMFPRRMHNPYSMRATTITIGRAAAYAAVMDGAVARALHATLFDDRFRFLGLVYQPFPSLPACVAACRTTFDEANPHLTAPHDTNTRHGEMKLFLGQIANPMPEPLIAMMIKLASGCEPTHVAFQPGKTREGATLATRGCAFVWVRLEDHEHIVRSMHKRVLVDINGWHIARTPAAVDQLHRYCAMLKCEQAGRLDHFARNSCKCLNCQSRCQSAPQQPVTVTRSNPDHMSRERPHYENEYQPLCPCAGCQGFFNSTQDAEREHQAALFCDGEFRNEIVPRIGSDGYKQPMRISDVTVKRIQETAAALWKNQQWADKQLHEWPACVRRQHQLQQLQQLQQQYGS